MSAPPTIIVMGVAGCGKSLIGEMLARHLGGVFEDADDFHTDAAREKMRSGTPLDDDDRRPWYARLRARVEEMRGITPHYVLACSALKQMYREWLRAGDDASRMIYIHLDGSHELILERMSRRQGHYMPVSLLDSQFAILERGDDIVKVSIEGEPDEIVADILQKLRQP
jgi:gluconokinase